MNSTKTPNPDFFLSSTENVDLEGPRECRSRGLVSAFGRDDCLLIQVSPPVIGQAYGLGEKDIDHLVIASRFKGSSAVPVSEWPLPVYVVGLTAEPSKDAFLPEDYEFLGWAEIYPTLERAKQHR